MSIDWSFGNDSIWRFAISCTCFEDSHTPGLRLDFCSRRCGGRFSWCATADHTVVSAVKESVGADEEG